MKLPEVIEALRALHGAPRSAAPTSPWGQLLWESCCYLADDEERERAFALLEQRTRLQPGRILAASDASLREVAAHGVVPDQTVVKLRACAKTALDDFGGDVDAALRALAPDEARRALRRFPAIGEPGAEKILLHAGLLATVALESNGLRVVERLGLVGRHASYPQAWRAARRALAAEGPADVAGLVELHALLRRHGQTHCTRARPRCGECPLAGGDVRCPYPRR